MSRQARLLRSAGFNSLIIIIRVYQLRFSMAGEAREGQLVTKASGVLESFGCVFL